MEEKLISFFINIIKKLFELGFDKEAINHFVFFGEVFFLVFLFYFVYWILTRGFLAFKLGGSNPEIRFVVRGIVAFITIGVTTLYCLDFISTLHDAMKLMSL